MGDSALQAGNDGISKLPLAQSVPGCALLGPRKQSTTAFKI